MTISRVGEFSKVLFQIVRGMGTQLLPGIPLILSRLFGLIILLLNGLVTLGPVDLIQAEQPVNDVVGDGLRKVGPVQIGQDNDPRFIVREEFKAGSKTIDGAAMLNERVPTVGGNVERQAIAGAAILLERRLSGDGHLRGLHLQSVVLGNNLLAVDGSQAQMEDQIARQVVGIAIDLSRWTHSGLNVE